MEAKTFNAPILGAFSKLTAALLLAGLASCGGGSDSEPASARLGATAQAEGDREPATHAAIDHLNPGYVSAVFAEGAKLNEAELLAAAARQGDSQTESVSAKFAGLITAFRFSNTLTGAHFYTVSVAERNSIQASLPHFRYEGSAFYASAVASPGLSPVHRFYNTQTGVHFYTITPSERTQIQQTMPHFRYEGIAYYASRTAGTGLLPLNRFFVGNRGFHFFSASQSETDAVRANPALQNYQFEGVAYHVLSANYTARTVVLPHTGIPDTRCYGLGSNSFVTCASDLGQSLYLFQDGHRAAIRPMTYSEVPAPAGGFFARTECVRDNVTGLVWEGKNAVEPRSESATFTRANLQGYVNYVNSIGLCGFTNWRVPTLQELTTIVDYGVSSGPRLNTEWFPNTTTSSYWTTSNSARYPTSQGWLVSFSNGSTFRSTFTSNYRVRLVRHAP